MENHNISGRNIIDGVHMQLNGLPVLFYGPEWLADRVRGFFHSSGGSEFASSEFYHTDDLTEFQSYANDGDTFAAIIFALESMPAGLEGALSHLTKEHKGPITVISDNDGIMMECRAHKVRARVRVRVRVTARVRVRNTPQP